MIDNWWDAGIAALIIALLLLGLAAVQALTVPSFVIVTSWAAGTLIFMNLVCGYGRPRE